jgi:transcription antitermination protein NusB
MTRRSRAREVALQLLFQRDANPDVPRRAIEQFARDRLGNPEGEAFCLSLYDGVVRSLSDIDARITAASENWKLHRMAASDRNVLRLGTYEIAYALPPVPGPVALDEAIELARRYGSKDSPGFVNGVLDKVFRTNVEQQKQSATPATALPPTEAAVTPAAVK